MKTKKISWQAIAIVVLALVLIASIALGVSGAWFQDRDTGKSDATLGHAVNVRLQDVDGNNGVKGWETMYDSTKTYAYPGDVIVGTTKLQMASTSPALIRMKVTPLVKDSADTTKVDADTAAVTLDTLDGVTSPTSLADTANLKAYYDKLMSEAPVRGNFKNGTEGDAAFETAYNTWKAKADKWNLFLLQNMTSGLKLDTSKWILAKDGYWYYNTVYGAIDAKSAATAATIDLFNEAKLSGYLTNEVAQWKVTLNLEVEAIQAAHANEAEHPWNTALQATELSGLKTLVENYNTGRELTPAKP